MEKQNFLTHFPRVSVRISHGIIAAIASFALLALAEFHSAVFNPTVGVPLILSVFLVLGWCVSFPFSPNNFVSQNLFEILISFVAVSFTNLLAIFIIPALAGYVFHLTLIQVLVFFLLLCVALSFINMAVSPEQSNQSHESDPILLGILLFIIALTLFFAQYYGCWLNGDYGWHGATIRKLVELSPIRFSDYLIKPLAIPQYGHNIWHLFLALIVRIAHADTGVVWLNINTFVSILRISALYLLARQLFGSQRWAVVSTIMYLLFCSLLSIEIIGDMVDIEHKWAWSNSGYPSVIARDVLLNITLYFVLKGVKIGKPYVWQIGILAACIALTHFYYIYLLMFILVTLYVASLFLRGDEISEYRRQALSILLALAPAIVYALVYKQLLDQPTVNPMFLSTTALGDFQQRVHMLWGRFPYISPMLGYFRNPYFLVATLCSIPLIGALFTPKVKLWQVYLIAPALVVAVIFFFPPLLMLAKHFNPALDRIWRIAEIIPVTLMPCGALYWMVDKKYISFQTVRMVLIAALVLLIPSMIQFHRQIIYNSSVWNGLIERLAVKQRAINQVIPAGSAVCVEPEISWPWAIMCPHYIYAHIFPACFPPNYDPTERVNTWYAFFKGTDRMDNLQRIAHSEVEYIVFKKSTWDTVRDIPADYWDSQTYLPQADVVVCRLHKKAPSIY